LKKKKSIKKGLLLSATEGGVLQEVGGKRGQWAVDEGKEFNLLNKTEEGLVRERLFGP